MLTIGSLCTGYGGLDLAVEEVFEDTELLWISEIDKNASKVCDARFPGIPNLGDIKAVDWTEVDPVDILTAGYPCQPFSYAGKRLGEKDDRHLWPHIHEAIRTLRPRYVILENVPGHRRKGFGTVVGQLAEERYRVRWTSLRARDIGAPHNRERVFILASL